jgi:hypothetical protein
VHRLLSFRILFSLTCALYVISFPYHPALRSPNELCRLWQSRALIDENKIDINTTISTLGMVGDLSCTATTTDGTLKPCVGPNAPPRESVTAVHYYPSKAPLLSFLGAPVYWVVKQFGEVTELSQMLFSRLFVTILPTLLMLLLLRKFLTHFVRPEVSDFVTCIYALGTMALSYSLSFMSHQLTAVLLFCTFYVAFLIEEKGKSPRLYALVGILGGATVACEYTGALGVVAVSSYVIFSRFKNVKSLITPVLLVVLGSIPFLAFIMLYHRAAFGSPFVSGYKFLNDAAYMDWHQGGFLGIKFPDARAFGLSLFSPLRGLFALSPFLICSIWGVQFLKSKSKALFGMTVALIVANLYFTSSFNYDSWGWTTGPRHLTPLIPFLMVPFALFLESASGIKSSIGYGLGVASALATMIVVQVNYVPPELSTSIFGLAVPLFSESIWPVSWLQASVPNPASGVFILLLSGAIGFLLLAKARTLLASLQVMLVVVCVYFGVMKLITKNDDADNGAKNFMKSVWLAPNRTVIQFRAP